MRVLIASQTYLDPANRGKLRALAALGCTVSAAVPARWAPRARGPLHTAEWGNDGGVQIAPIHVVGSPRGEAIRWRARDLGRLLREFRPEVVQIEAEPWTPIAALVSAQAQRLGFPTVVFTWQSVRRSYSFAERWRRRRTLRRARALLGGNKLAASLLARERPGVPLAVIPQTGITPPLEIRRPESPGLAIGFVGRLVPEKGLDCLFRALVKLHGRWNLTVVGSGPEQEHLEGLAERLGIASRVAWLGALPPADLATLWPELDCLVVPSRSTPQWVEAFHPALIQAMGHGVTVVVADSGALPELVDTAGLVVPEDDVPALAAALQHLADAPRERARLGREARLRVMSQYVDDAVARRTVEFWDQVLRRPSPH